MQGKDPAAAVQSQRDNYYTVTTLGLPMRVVGGGAHIARGPAARTCTTTPARSPWRGETAEVIVDTAA